MKKKNKTDKKMSVWSYVDNNYLFFITFLIIFLLASSIYSQNVTTAAKSLAFWIDQGEDYQLFNDIMLAPSRETGLNKYTIMNRNEEVIEVDTKFHFEVQRSGYTKGQLNNMLAYYEISGNLTYNEENLTYEWQTLESFIENFHNRKFAPLKPNGKYEFEYNIRLSEEADNTFQGANLVGVLTLSSKTNIHPEGGSSTPPKRLPKTATNQMNLLMVGLILIILGVVMLSTLNVIRKKGGGHDGK